MSHNAVIPAYHSHWQLRVDPADGLIDTERRILVEGLTPGASITLSATTERGQGVHWHSQATFQADEHGTVDTATQAPISGDYAQVSAMGLIWSQQPAQESAREVFADDPSAPLLTTIRAIYGEQSQTAPLVQRLAASGVTRHPVRDNGLVGTLFLPSGQGPHPAVIVLNGSGGGMNEPRAALYASHGYAALALAYFKAPGLSDYISNTPLEYFKQALDWLRETIKPAHDFVALSGQSRGGELVLLLGSIYPKDVSAVIAYVPGAVVHSGQNACDPAVGREGPAWLLNGKALTHVWENNASASWEPWDTGPEPRRHAHAILTALQDTDAVHRARIQVERIQGPVMCLSGSDDGSWPSSLYGRMVEQALQQAQHPYPHAHHDYEGAGHAILFPWVPTTQTTYAHPVSGRLSTGGGTPSTNAHANQDSWSAVVAFLNAAVHTRATDQHNNHPLTSDTP